MATDSVELLALQRIDETCMQLQQQGNYLQALECMERGLVLRQHFFGSDSEEVWSACKIVGEMCNLLAMTYLQQEDFGMVLELLKKAEILTERDDAGRAVTYNNLACYYRRRGKLHSALQYLHKALKIEAKMGSRVEHPADTHLNTCAVLSQIGRHQGALEHAQSALILLQEELFGGGAAVGDAGGEGGNQPPRADRIAVLAIAYHNMGVEQEFLKKFEHSLQSYRKGVEVAQRYLGGNHAVTVTLRNSTMAARRAISARDSKVREDLIRRGNRRPRGGACGGGERAGRPRQPNSDIGTGVLSHALSAASVATPQQPDHKHQQQQQQQHEHQDERLHKRPPEGKNGASIERGEEKAEMERGADEKADKEIERGDDDKAETDRVARGLMQSTALEPAPPPAAEKPATTTEAKDAGSEAEAEAGADVGAVAEVGEEVEVQVEADAKAADEDMPKDPRKELRKISGPLDGDSVLGAMISPRPDDQTDEHQGEGDVGEG
ncbi:unnamed protein product [Ectocarpus sp. 12 AP-2014]